MMNIGGSHPTQVRQTNNNTLLCECEPRNLWRLKLDEKGWRHKRRKPLTMLLGPLPISDKTPHLLRYLLCCQPVHIPEKQIRVPYNLNAPRSSSHAKAHWWGGGRPSRTAVAAMVTWSLTRANEREWTKVKLIVFRDDFQEITPPQKSYFIRYNESHKAHHRLITVLSFI